MKEKGGEGEKERREKDSKTLRRTKNTKLRTTKLVIEDEDHESENEKSVSSESTGILVTKLPSSLERCGINLAKYYQKFPNMDLDF